MSRHDARIFILQMRDHAAEALAMSEGRVREDLDADRTLEPYTLAEVRDQTFAIRGVPPEVHARGPSPKCNRSDHKSLVSD